MPNYQFGGTSYSPEDARWQDVLAKAYEKKVRPSCMCITPAPSMYISRANARYIIKRMPGSGSTHGITCDSYEAPAILSGIGEVMGTAIQEDLETGNTTLKLGFALSKVPGKLPPEPSDESKDTVKSPGTELSMLSTLQYLWSEAQFHRWSPKMDGKRNWGLIRHYLLKACEQKLAKNKPLSSLLYCPESWSQDAKERIAESRRIAFSKISESTHGKRSLMLLIGEVKSFSPSRSGVEMKIKHADIGFQMKESLYKALQKHFAPSIDLWDAHIEDGAHLIAIATFGVNQALTPEIEEISLMLTTPGWIPIEGVMEWTLVNKVHDQKRHFIKGLRFNLSKKKPLASVLLTDTENACALFIQPASPPENFSQELYEMLIKDPMDYWIWDAAHAMPDIPEPMIRQPTIISGEDSHD